MADDTTNLALPFILAAQSQKHVTHNEALTILDGLVQLSVADQDRTSPPGSPVEGRRHIVAAGATGAWIGWDESVVMWSDGAWLRLVPREGWLAWVEEDAEIVVYTGGNWSALPAAAGMLERAASVTVAEVSNGATLGMAILQQTLSGLSGATVTSTIEIPDRAIVLGVSTRTTTAITGASSYDCGITGDLSKFGGSLGIAAGSTNVGVIGPQAFYAATPIKLTANGGNFSGGAVKIAIQYLQLEAPTA